MQLLAIDLGKQSFHVHGISNDGEVISTKVTRSKLEAAIQELSPEAIAMEACASAHHWGRRFEAMGFSGSPHSPTLRYAIRQRLEE